jgi:hypothetical protein
MRPRFVISVLILALIILAVVLWRRPVQSPGNAEQPQAPIQSTREASAASTGTISQSNPIATPGDVSVPSNPPVIGYSSPLRKPGAFQQYVEQHNVAVDFYGQFIDQDSNALSDVDIKVTVRHWTMPSPAVLLAGSKDIPLEQKSGTDGRFELTGATGDVFDIQSIQKDGYDVESGKRTFGAVGGSFENPVIFKMWSTNVHEQLITGEKKFPIVPDGRPYVIDLTQGTIAESGAGNLKVWVKRPEQITYGNRYDWSCEMDAINGGLLQESDGNSSMSLAPADGYTPSFQFEQKIGSGWGDSTGAKRFYVTLNNGQAYGRITIELYAYYNDRTPGLIRLSYAINPSGSPILR